MISLCGLLRRMMCALAAAGVMIGTATVALAQDVEVPERPAPSDLHFESLTVSDGLSHNTITAIIQDSRGFIWIGTQDGLNRFDGYDFVTYRHEPDDPNSLSHNHVRALVEDAAGALWIATYGGGLNRFDPDTATFTYYHHVPDDPTSLGADDLFALYQDRNHHLWIGGPPTLGLDRLDASQVTALAAGAEISPTFQHYVLSSLGDPDVSDPLKPSSFRSGVQVIAADVGSAPHMTEDLWVAADLALIRLDTGSGEMDVFFPPDEENLLRAIAQDAAGNVWLGGLKGLYRFDPEAERFTQYDVGFGVSSLYVDGETLWVGGRGLYTFDLRTERLTRRFGHQEGDPDSLVGDRVTVLMRDAGGILWIGTTEGISILDSSQQQFTHYRSDPAEAERLDADPIQAMTGDADGNVWMAMPQAITYMNPSTGEARHYDPAPDRLFLGPGLSSLYLDRAGDLWSGAGDRLYRLDVETGTFERYDGLRARDRAGPPPSISAIVEDGQGDLWVAMTLTGLHRLNRATGTFDAYLPDAVKGRISPQSIASDQLSALHVGRAGDLWIGYRDGIVSRLDTAGRFTHYVPDTAEQTPSFGWIDAIYEDEAGILWLATRRGLVRFDAETAVTEIKRGVLAGPARRYDENDGLPATYVHSLLVEDGAPTLWLGTANGLSRFDPDAETFDSFDEADGVGGQHFNPRAAWRAPDGRMYFGSTEGFTAFYPDQIALSGYEPFVVLTELRLANEPVTVKPGGTLDHAIWDLNRLTLRHDDDIVSFAFAALDYAAPQKLQYQYRLQGLERDWVTVDSEHRFATYTHLPAGEYVFRVQGTNKSGVWSRHEAALALTVLPAWWETGWFRAGVAILLIGAVTAGVRWRMHDLEQRSRALEVEVAARTKRLQESEKRFREMTELLPNAVVELDAGYQITYVNRSGLSLFGYSEADIDKGLNAMDLLKPEARERAVQRIGQYIAGKDLPPTEYQIQTKDGTEMPVLLKAAPIQQDGEIRGFRASLTDISELTAAQDELAAALERARRLQDKAEAANQAKSTFLANMSHELRTPLNAILGYSQLMARDADVTSVQRENLAVVIRSGEHLLGLINDILALSKIEAGCKTFQAGAFDLHRLVQSLQEMFQLRADDKRLTLQVEITADVPRYIVTDEGKLRQVLMNLLSNAVKFTDEGGVTVRVGGRPYQADEASRISRFHPLSPDFLLRIEVEDSGVGIAPDELDALFDPFVQTFSGRQSQEGTGLGLPISQQFVDLMGGELSVKSVISRGAIFGVHLPVVQTDADSAAVEVRPRRRVKGIEPGQTAPDGGLFRLLVVEDRATNRNLLLKLLRPFGFEMRSAAHGMEGIELWETWEPHLVWMDMRMPVMDGYTATREIKARAAVEGRATVVVALTASSFEEDREAILAAGCDDSIRKPYRERDVFDVLHRHLGIHFIYEDDPPALAERDESAGCTSRDTLQTALTEMSAAWADALYEAAAALDADRMLALIEALRPQAPDVADILTQWVHDYEYDKIIALLEPEH